MRNYASDLDACDAYKRGEIDLDALSVELGQDVETALQIVHYLTQGRYGEDGNEKKPNKFHNIPTDYDDCHFESQKEAQRYVELRLLVRIGDIKDLRVHPKYVLQEAFKGADGKVVREIYHKPDFSYTVCETGEMCVEDVKGGTATQTRNWKNKYKLFLKRYPNITYKVVER